MSYKPQRTFNGTQGNPSTDTMGPEQLSHDIDELCKMFNPNAVHDDGSAGGVTPDNMSFTADDINDIGGVASSDIKAVRKNANGDLEYSTDGVNFYPAFAREANYLPLAGGTMTGTLNMNSQKVTNLPLPTDNAEPATKQYVDSADSNIDAALALKAPLESPVLTGTPTAPTAAVGTNTTQIATTAFTKAAVDGLGNNVYTKTEADNKYETITNANALVKNISYSANTGTFTITTQGGTSKSIDTVAIPSQTGKSGQYLTTNGTDVSWGVVDALPAQSGQSGKYLTTNGTNASWATVDALPSQSGQNGKFLTTNGANASWTDTPMVKGVDYVTAGKKASTTLGTRSTAEGYDTTASGNESHAEGNNTIASEESAHAEGAGTTASGIAAHAEGFSTEAIGTAAHAEGFYTTASAKAHAEGSDTEAIAIYSHAEGFSTTANHKSQHVFGEYNVIDTNVSASTERGDYVEIVGNGTGENARSNARTLDWSGNETLAGKLTVGSDPTNNMDVTTKKYVDDAVAGAGVLPSQSGHSGEFLTTDGSSPSWATVDALPSQSGQNGKFLKTNGTTASWSDTPMLKGVDYVTAGRAEHSTLGTYATAEGYDTRAVGNYSHAEGSLTYTNGSCAHAEGQETEARAHTSHAEGYNTLASNSGAHAEGNGTIASGQYAHAEGATTTASANYAHAEGESTTASGVSAHAEGSHTTASGVSAHAEGSYTTASGLYSHAEGRRTTANHYSQHVFGEYNVLDANASASTERGDYIEIVGNGTATNARSNARTLDWSGNEVLAGKLTVGTAPSNNMDVTTKQYVDTAVSGILPAQSGNSGKFLTTNGSAISWANAPNGVFWVTITATQSPQTYEWTISADKTVAEIKAAIAGGKLPVANIFDGAFNCVYPLTNYNDNFTLDYIDFLGVTADREVIRYSVTSGDVSGDRWYRNAISTSGTFIGTIATSYSQFNDELYSFKMVFLRDEDGVASTDTFYQLTKQDYGAKILYFTKVEGDNLYTISIDEHDVVTRTTTKIGIPPQTGQSGKFLTTDGTDVSWASVPSAPSASSTTPAMDGTAAAGTETAWAHGDHVHPTDTSRQAKITASGLLKGDGNGGITAAVAGTDYLTLATLPIYNGTVN